jgi:hypothetical protein
MLAEGEKLVKGQWSPIREEWALEREQLASARGEWEAKVRSMESNLSAAATMFDAWLITLQQQQQQQYGIGNGEVVKGCSHHQHGRQRGLMMPPSPCSLCADSGRPRHRHK